MLSQVEKVLLTPVNHTDAGAVALVLVTTVVMMWIVAAVAWWRCLRD